MADIRINSLPSTATSFNTDDYIAIDGASAGTRKMLAANPPFTDVTLGASGPSVKSTLSARAPRQGLVFDGSGTKATLTVPAFGTGDFTASAWVREDNSFAGTPVLMIGSGVGGFYMEFDANGFPYVDVQGGAGVQRKATTACVLKKLSLITYVKTSGTGIWYVNGIAAGSAADSNNYTGGIAALSESSPYNLTGFIAPLIYNRALSASEVVALYESGAPSANDIPGTAAGTAIAASAGVNAGNVLTSFTSSSGQWQGTVSAATTPYVRYAAGRLNAGNVIRISGTVAFSGGTLSYFGVTQQGSGTGSASLPTSNGNFDVTITAHSYQASGLIDFYFAGSGVTVTVTNLSITPLGLLLAPDAAQAGGGLTWYDTSGNTANITLPASGVSWNVPSSSYWGGTLNLSGSTNYLKISTTGTPASGAAALQLSFNGTNSRGIRLTNVDSGGRTYDIISGGGGDAASFGLYDDTSAAYRLFVASSGNLLIGTTTDGGQKLQVSGTAYVSGNATFAGEATVNGTNGVLVNKTGGGLSIITVGDGTSGGYCRLNMRNGPSKYGWSIATQDITDNALTITPSTAAGGTSFTTPVLTLAQSGDATFAGKITTSAPTGGAGAWELGVANTVSPTAPNRTITIEIGGSVYYLHAKTTND